MTTRSYKLDAIDSDGGCRRKYADNAVRIGTAHCISDVVAESIDFAAPDVLGVEWEVEIRLLC